MRMAKSGDMSMRRLPPGIRTVTEESTNPSLRATAAAAELLLPDAKVYPAPRSQISIAIVLRSITHRNWTFVRFGKSG